QTCRPWAVNGTSWDFGHELLANDFDKIEDSIAFAYKRFPALESAGVKSVIHGPFTFAPDGNPLVGPVPGMRNYWSACAVMAGFSQGGGVGLTLAQWMVEGEAERDVFAMDCARFGSWITPGYTVPKVIENYQRRFSVSYPNEELPAARGLRRTPMYDHFSTMGAVWGAQFGLEVPNYFAQAGEARYETPSFRRSNAWDAVKREVKAVRSAVGINEVHNFSKFSVSGPNTRAWLDRIMAGRIPQIGRLSLTPMLSPKGKLIGDFTVSCIREDLFQLTASYGSQAYHQRWFEQNMAPGVTLQNISDQRTGFQIAGPQAAKVLQACTTANVADIKFLDVIELVVGSTACLVQQVSYAGDHGYEIYCDPMAQRALWDTLWEAGQPYGITPFGMRAMMSLRLDRFFGSWLSEFSPDYTAAETGLDRFISFRKPVDFIGRSAAEAERLNPPERQLVIFEVDALDADVVAYEPVFINGTVQGFCTSGGYSHHAEKSIAFALVPRAAVKDDLRVEIEILGQLRPARRLLEPLL
ncbi:MAG: FAD-dependent oxidoreductase, partial [Planktomarina sp.]